MNIELLKRKREQLFLHITILIRKYQQIADLYR